MKNSISILLSLLSLSLVGYVLATKDKIDVDELARATGITRFEIKITEDLKAGEFMGTAWFKGDELLRYDTNIQGFEPGSSVTCYVWTHSNASYLKFSLFENENRMMLAQIKPIPEYPFMKNTPYSGRVFEAGDVLMIFTNKEREEVSLEIVNKNYSNQSW